MVLSQFLLKVRKCYAAVIDIVSDVILVLSYIAVNLFCIAFSAYILYTMPEVGVYREFDPSPLSTSVVVWVLLSVLCIASYYVNYRCIVDNIKNDDDFGESKISFARLFYIHTMLAHSSFFSMPFCLLIAEAKNSDLGNASYGIWCTMTAIGIVVIEYAYKTGKKARSQCKRS